MPKKVPANSSGDRSAYVRQLADTAEANIVTALRFLVGCNVRPLVRRRLERAQAQLAEKRAA